MEEPILVKAEEVPKLEVIFKIEGEEPMVFRLTQKNNAILENGSYTEEYTELTIIEILNYLQRFFEYRKSLEVLNGHTLYRPKLQS